MTCTLQSKLPGKYRDNLKIKIAIHWLSIELRFKFEVSSGVEPLYTVLQTGA